MLFRSCGTGACFRSNGVEVCGAGTWSAVVSCTPGSPGTETCNGVDDDCNGAVDNGVSPTSQVCTVGTGACMRVGTQSRTCNGAAGWGAWGACSATAGSPGTETCNGVDDDCDGTVDDGISPTSSGCTQTGNCAGATKTCSGGSWSACSIVATTEVCDGADNDCNGVRDNGFTCVRGSCAMRCGVSYLKSVCSSSCTWGACIVGTC